MSAKTALRNFTRLSSSVLLHTPSSSASATVSDPKAPHTILLCPWLDASTRHIAKYTDTYISRYPSSRVLLVTCDFKDFTYNLSSRLTPALEVLGSNSDEKLLVHVFSNGGSHQLLRLASLYRKATGQKLAIRGIILDSCPGSSQLRKACAGFTTSLASLPWWRRWVATVGVYVHFFLLGAVMLVLKGRNPIQAVREGLNDEELIVREARRAYVFGADDTVVRVEDVEEHLQEATKKGYRVRKERFEGTGHVQHARGGEERYWKIVAECWGGDGWD